MDDFGHWIDVIQENTPKLEDVFGRGVKMGYAARAGRRKAENDVSAVIAQRLRIGLVGPVVNGVLCLSKFVRNRCPQVVVDKARAALRNDKFALVQGAFVEEIVTHVCERQ